MACKGASNVGQYHSLVDWHCSDNRYLSANFLMANAYRIEVGDMVSYLTDEDQPRWRAVKVTGVVSQTSLNLAYVSMTGARIAINGGVPVTKWDRLNPTTNAWRPY